MITTIKLKYMYIIHVYYDTIIIITIIIHKTANIYDACKLETNQGDRNHSLLRGGTLAPRWHSQSGLQRRFSVIESQTTLTLQMPF